MFQVIHKRTVDYTPCQHTPGNLPEDEPPATSPIQYILSWPSKHLYPTHLLVNSSTFPPFGYLPVVGIVKPWLV